MRVTLVAPHDAGHPTGILAYVAQLARRAPPDIEVQVRHLAKREAVLMGRRVGGTLSTWASLLGLDVRDADVVHATDTFCLAKGASVLTIHDLIPAQVMRHLGARIHQRLFAGRLRAVRRIITPTRVVAQQVHGAFGIPMERITPIHQGFDDHIFYPVDDVPPAVDPAKHNLLYVGAYRPYKHIDKVLAALEGRPDVRFIRLGPPGRDAYHQLCLDTARRAGVDFVDAGYVDGAQLRAYYSACDLLVYPSRDEGFGIPPLEAMACGTPSLLSDIPVFREIYGELAAYAEDATPAALRRAIDGALAHPSPAAPLQAHASRFTWDDTARKTYAVYREVAGEGPQGPRRS